MLGVKSRNGGSGGPFSSQGQAGAITMSDDKGINTGPNSRPLNDTIAGTGPGIQDDALAPGEEMPTAPTDEEVAAAARKLGAPAPDAEPQASGD